MTFIKEPILKHAFFAPRVAAGLVAMFEALFVSTRHKLRSIRMAAVLGFDPLYTHVSLFRACGGCMPGLQLVKSLLKEVSQGEKG